MEEVESGRLRLRGREPLRLFPRVASALFVAQPLAIPKEFAADFADVPF